jgi:hypothetical protein
MFFLKGCPLRYGISLAKAHFMIPLQLFVQRRIVSLPKTASAQRDAKAMCESSVGCILVTDDQNHLEGIITEADSHKVEMDTKSPIGTDTALTPKQLLLAGICGCTIGIVVSYSYSS